MDTKKLRQKILDLAIHGKLVPQDPNDEPANVLLERIRAEKERLIAEGKIKRSKKPATSDMSHYENVPFDVPEGWCWCTLDELTTSIGDGLHGTPKFDDNGEYYFVNGNNLDGIISIKKETKRTTIDEYTKQGLKFNSQTIFVSINGTLGNIAFYNNEPIVLGKSACYINLLDSISKEYIATILRCQYFINYCRDTATGSTIKNVPLAAMRTLFIPIPSYQEQLRIVDEVEKLLSLVDLLDENTNELGNAITVARSKILDLAIHGKLVPQDANDEPASELLKRINSKAVASCDNPHYEQLPDRWCICTLEDIVDYEQPQAYIVNSTAYSDIYEVPVLTAGKSFIIGYTNEQDGICDNLPVIIFDDFTTDSKYVDFPFKVKSSAMKILHVKAGINIKYVAYFMSVTRLIGDTHKRYWISEYSKVNIPLPPKAEQDRIVRQIERLMCLLDSIAETLD